MKMLRTLLLLLPLLFGGAQAFAQGAGQLGPGQVWGNDTAAQRTARAASISAMLDRALGSTADRVVWRGASNWSALAIGACNSAGSALSYVTGTGFGCNSAIASSTSAITNDTTTNATMFLTWVTTNSGNQSLEVTSTKLTFNPSTGALSSTNFLGTFNGNTFTTGTGTLTIAASKTLTVNNTVTINGTDGATYTFPNATATIPRVVASGAKALAIGAIGSATCTLAQTDTATGTLTTDTITVAFSADPTATTGYVPLTTGMLTIIYYPTADTVNFKVCNNTGASITPGAVTINWRVIR